MAAGVVAAGVVVVARDCEVTTAPAWPLPSDGGVRDSTGAGDAFIGAIAVGLRNRLPLESVLRLASYVGAANVQADGARGGMPQWEALPEELKGMVARVEKVKGKEEEKKLTIYRTTTAIIAAVVL